MSTCRPAHPNCSASTNSPAAAISTSRWWRPAQARSASPQSLDGTALLTGHDGAIAGFNVEQLLKRLERRPLSGGGNFRQGSTPYDNLTVALKFSDGIATAEDIRLEGPTAKLTLTGTASVPTREYDMKGVASLISAPNAAPASNCPSWCRARGTIR